MNNLVRLTAITLFAVAVVLAVVGLVSGQRKPAATPTATTAPVAVTHKTVVALKALPAGQKINAADLRVEAYPTRLDGSFDTPAALEGEIPAITLSSGAPVLKAFLSQSFALNVASGERAVAVRVDEAIGVSNRVRPGDWVDVFVTLKKQGDEVGVSSARLLLAKLKVLAYGDKSATSAEKTDSDERPKRADAARTAVLAVPVDQVSALLLGEASGRLALALRHPDDMGAPQPGLWTNAPALGLRSPAKLPEDQALAGTRLDSLAGGNTRTTAKPVATPSRPAASSNPSSAPRSVEVIRNGKRESVPY